MTMFDRVRDEADPAARCAYHATDARFEQRLSGLDDIESQVFDAVLAPVDWAWSVVWLLEWVRRGR